DERGEQSGRGVAGREEEGREERRQGRVEVEVVPLEDGSQGGGEDDAPGFLGLNRADGSGHGAHGQPPIRGGAGIWCIRILLRLGESKELECATPEGGRGSRLGEPADEAFWRFLHPSPHTLR